MSEESQVMDRIVRLEQADKDLSEHIQRLAVQTERIAQATETLQKAIDKQYEVNSKLHEIELQVSANKNSLALIKMVGTAVMTGGISLVLIYLFGKPPVL